MIRACLTLQLSNLWYDAFSLIAIGATLGAGR